MPAVLDGLLDKKTASLLKVLLKNKDEIYHLHSLSRASKVPVSSTSRIVTKLIKLDLITTRKVGNMVLFQASNSEKAKLVGDLL